MSGAARQWPKAAAGAGAAIVLAVLGGPVAALYVAAARRIPLHTVGLFNEGWNAFHAKHAWLGQTLYPNAASLVSNNYPPLSFYLVGGLGELVGDHIVAGRALALASQCFVGLLVGVIVHRLTRSIALGACAALVFLGYAAIHLIAYFTLNDPQWLAHAFATSGLLVFLIGRNDPKALVLTALLVLAGGLVKHSMLAVPAAITLWLAWHDRRGLGLWMLVSTVGVLAVACVLYLGFGADVFVSILGTPREVRLHYVWLKLWLWLPHLAPYLVGCVLLLVLDHRERGTRLLGLYALLALLLAATMLSGAGVSYNALFDLVIVSVVASAVVVERLEGRAVARGFGPGWIRTGGMVLLALPILLSVPDAIEQARRRAKAEPLKAVIDADDVAFIAAQAGPALCEKPALCYWAGKPFEVDMFNSYQKADSGVLDPGVLESLIEERYFAVMQIGVRDPRLPRSRFLDMVLQHYDVVQRRNSRWLLVPRQGQSK